METRLKAPDLLADILAAEGIHVWEDWNEDKNKYIALEAMRQFAEQEAKAFAEYCESYVGSIEDMTSGNCEDMRKDPLRNMDSAYYNFDTKQWAKDYSEIYKQFKSEQK